MSVSGGGGASGERRLDGGGKVFRLVGRRVAAHDFTVSVDQELGEIPLDRLRAEEARRYLLQRPEQRMGVRAVDLGLGEHGKGDVVIIGAEFLDRLLVARLLMAELVARESEHGEAARAKPPMQLFQPRILRRERSPASALKTANPRTPVSAFHRSEGGKIP
jgi:hypothetical protein